MLIVTILQLFLIVLLDFFINFSFLFFFFFPPNGWSTKSVRPYSSPGRLIMHSPSKTFDLMRAGIEPAQNLSSRFVEWSCAVVIITIPWRQKKFYLKKLYWTIHRNHILVFQQLGAGQSNKHKILPTLIVLGLAGCFARYYRIINLLWFFWLC